MMAKNWKSGSMGPALPYCSFYLLNLSGITFSILVCLIDNFIKMLFLLLSRREWKIICLDGQHDVYVNEKWLYSYWLVIFMLTVWTRITHLPLRNLLFFNMYIYRYSWHGCLAVTPLKLALVGWKPQSCVWWSWSGVINNLFLFHLICTYCL